MNEQQEAVFERLLEQVQKPARYTGGEMNTDVKPWEEAEVRFAFGFPDTYDIAMSHLGIKILYHIINRLPWGLCERVFTPWPDMGDGMRREGLPLFSLESRHPVRDFDIVGFTLQYEMSYTNILEMLDLAGIPAYARDRGEDDPLIVAGGPCAYNPEPLAPVVDAYMIGDGEDVMIQLCSAVREHKKAGTSKEALLKALAGIHGVYVPRFYDVSYHADGTIAAMTPNDACAPEKVERCVVTDLNGADYPETIPVPYTDVVFDRIVLEIMRGCTRGCRFCQAGMIYRPVRERSLERLIEIADRLEASTGYEEISLSSLSTGDYSCLPELIQSLMDRYQEKRVSISLPSMRIDNIVKQSLEMTQRVKKSGLTLAPEAGTQRLRDVINKGVTEDDLIRSVTDAFECGWSTVKLYFMMGLPTETDDDLRGIGDLAAKVTQAYYRTPKEKRGKGLRVTCSASVFVPKPFTPFQWAAQDTLDMVEEKQQRLREYLKIKNVVFNWHEGHLSFLEACISRGDRRIGDVIYTAWKKGCRFDGWNEHFRFDLWMEAFRECGLDPAFYAYRERPYDEINPWDIIDAGVTKEYLIRECEKAKAEKTTKDCRKGCNGCGLQRWKGVCACYENARHV